MATVPRQTQQREGAAAVLRGVSFQQYLRLVRHPGNRSLRFAYFDGTLEIMSPRIHKHERPAGRIRLIVTTVAGVLGLNYEGIGSGTIRKRGDGPLKGTGREPDEGFYIQNVDRLPQDRDPDLDAGDPPPDLWVEVDNRVSSRGRLPTYARLGVPEVWQYRAESGKLRFLVLEGSDYRRVDRSLALPVLTPALVLEALQAGAGVPEGTWVRWLRAWAEPFRPPVA